MKKFTKLFLSCAAVAALTAAVATSAMAAEGNVDLKGAITGTYYPEATTVEGTEIAAGTLTLTAPNAADEIKTVVVLDAEGETADPNTVQIENKNVIGIDQVTENTIVVKLDTTKVDTENKKYTVLIGGSAGQVYEAAFGKVGSTQLLGDVDGGGAIDVSDGSAILQHFVKVSTLEGDALQAADANDDGTVDVGDGSLVLQYFVKLDDSLGTKTIADKTTVVK